MESLAVKWERTGLCVSQAETVEKVWQEVWFEVEKVNFQATPMFRVKGRK